MWACGRGKTPSCEIRPMEAREGDVVSVDTARRNDGPNEWSEDCIEHPTLLSFWQPSTQFGSE